MNLGSQGSNHFLDIIVFILVGDKDTSARYRAAALRILDTLTSDAFLAASRPGWEGILLHGVYHRNKGLGVDESVMWGEHYFVEALVRAIHCVSA